MIEPGNVTAILLAAGGSRRFGAEDKLLARVAGAPMMLHMAHRIAALDAGRRIAVCASEAVASPLQALGFEIIWNRETGRGQSRSIALGIAAARDARAALVCLADMPFVTDRHLGALLARFDETSADIVASSDGAVSMPPALFGRRHFPLLETIEGDRGARSLLSGAALVRADGAELADIDSPEDVPKI